MKAMLPRVTETGLTESQRSVPDNGKHIIREFSTAAKTKESSISNWKRAE